MLELLLDNFEYFQSAIKISLIKTMNHQLEVKIHQIVGSLKNAQVRQLV